jgi:hypothetical protein
MAMRFTTNDIFTRKNIVFFYVCLNTIFFSGQKLYITLVSNKHVSSLSTIQSNSKIVTVIWKNAVKTAKIAVDSCYTFYGNS